MAMWSGANRVNKAYTKEVNMTRQEAKQNLINLGIEEPSDEAVTNYLNQVNGVAQKEKDRADAYKKDADKVKELTAKIQEMEDAKLSDIDKANRATEQANAQLEELKSQMKRMETMKALADKGITGEDAENLIHEDGSIDFETLGKIISQREEAAKVAKEQEIAKNSTNPNGGSSNDNGKDDKPEDVKMAEAISFGNSASEDAKDYYKIS